MGERGYVSQEISDDALLQQERREAEQFLRERGIITVPEIRAHLDTVLTTGEKEKIEAARKELEPLQETIRSLPSIKHLHELYQLGGKVNPVTQHYSAEEAFVFTPAFHTRYHHSELIAEQAILAGVKTGLTTNEIGLALSAGWFHDVGHSAFSHGGDELLIKHGRSAHEERTLAILDTTEVVEKLAAADVSAEDVKKVVKEKGKLGQLQKILDTLSYLSLDSYMVQQPLYRDYGAAVLADLRGLTNDALVVHNPEIWQQVMEDRAMMYKELYSHPLNKMSDEARRRLLEIGVKRGLVTLDEIERNGDDVVLKKLQELCQPSTTGQLMSLKQKQNLIDCKDLYQLSLGLHDVLSRWEGVLCDSKEEVQRYFNRTVTPRNVIEQAFVTAPFDYRTKKISVLTEDGKKHILKAQKCELRQEDSMYIVYAPKV